MDALWIHRVLVIVLTLSWFVAWRGGLLVFRQKLTPEYHPLPGLIRRHVNQGVVWAVLLVLTGLSYLVRMGGGPPAPDIFLMSALALAIVSATVVYTGYGLKIGKPTGVWVHVFLVLISTGLSIILLLKYLWDCLS